MNKKRTRQCTYLPRASIAAEQGIACSRTGMVVVVFAILTQRQYDSIHFSDTGRNNIRTEIAENCAHKTGNECARLVMNKVGNVTLVRSE